MIGVLLISEKNLYSLCKKAEIKAFENLKFRSAVGILKCARGIYIFVLYLPRGRSMLELANEVLKGAYTYSAARRLQLDVLLVVFLSVVDAVVLAVGVLAVHVGVAALGQRFA